MNSPRRGAAVDPNSATLYLQWWLLAAIVFEYARPAAFAPAFAVLPFNSLIPLSLFALCLFAKGLRPNEEIFKDISSRWILAYYGILAFSMVHANVTLYAFEAAKNTLGYVFLFFIVARVATTLDRVRGVFATLIIAHLFLLAMNPEAVMNPQQRNYIKGGTFLGDGNDFSLSVCILLPMAIELALAARSKLLRIVWWGCLLVLVLSIIASSSRGGTLGMVAVAGYLWLRSPRKGLTLAGVCVVVVILFAYAPDLYFQRMGTISHYEDDGSAMGRIMAWKAAIRMFLDHPLLGVGAAHFPVSFGTAYRPAGHENIPWLNAHSMYFMVLGELALPGIIALLSLIFGNLRANKRVSRQLASAAASSAPKELTVGADRLLYLLSASMLGFAVAGAFLSVAYYPHVFILTGLMVAVRNIVRQAANLPEEAAAGSRGKFRRGAGARRLQGARKPRGATADSRQARDRPHDHSV